MWSLERDAMKKDSPAYKRLCTIENKKEIPLEDVIGICTLVSAYSNIPYPYNCDTLWRTTLNWLDENIETIEPLIRQFFEKGWGDPSWVQKGK